MKLGNVISDAVYEQRLAELVSQLEARIHRTQNRIVRSGRTAAMIQVFETAGRPLTAREGAEMLPIPVADAVIGPFVGHLVRAGWLQKFDQIEQRWTHGSAHTVTVHKVWRFVVAPYNERRDPFVERYVDRFLARVDLLDQWRVRGACIGATLLPRASDDRQRAIIGARSEGMTLQTIGNRFGITRERVRQIIEAPMTRPPTRARRRGSYLPAAVWAGFEDELQEVRDGADTNHQA